VLAWLCFDLRSGGGGTTTTTKYYALYVSHVMPLTALTRYFLDSRVDTIIGISL
jgi:hypothetical protein